MRGKLVCISVALSLLLGTLNAVASPASRAYREALNLFQRGMYDAARSGFEALGEGPVYEGYAALCAGKLGTPDFAQLLINYEKAYPGSSLTSELHYQAALNLFDEQKYYEASLEFAKVVQKELFKGEQSQFVFKYGYCNFALGIYPEAKKRFEELVALPVCQYTAPAQYAMGFMYYTEKSFVQAEEWYAKCQNDPRFAELCSFYIVDCRFMLKDYRYVTETGTKLYENAPVERQQHLSRIISESYLVLGDNANAKVYYELGAAQNVNMKDSDYFYAGSVLYAVQDFQGAVENFEKMTDRSDSLWQIAAYQLGNSYIQLRDKVSALDAFKSASLLRFDPEIAEDASFNHAKLAFDLNNDGSFFESYLKKYSTSRKGEHIYGYMALARLANRDYSGAIDAYEKIENTNQEEDLNYLKANYLRAHQLVNAGAYSDAVDYLETAMLGLDNFDPFFQLSKYWLSECKYRSGDYKEAFNGFNSLYNLSALDGEPESDMLSYNAAYAAFKQGNYETAAKWFDRSLSSLPGAIRLDAMKRRADCDLGRNDYKSAIASYQKVIDALGGQADVYPYLQKAVCYGLDGSNAKKAETLALVEKFPASTPLYADAMYEKGSTLLAMKENTKALAAFSKMHNPSLNVVDQARGYLGEGMANANLRKFDSALESYKKVVSFLPGSEYAQDALLAIESIYQSMGEPQKYVEYLESIGATSGKTGEEKESLYFNAGEQNFISGNYAQAQTSLERYLQKFPQGERIYDAYYYLGECYLQQGDRMAACDMFGKSVNGGASHSYYENSLQSYADVNYALERFNVAYDAYHTLSRSTNYEERKTTAYRGMMNSAYRARDYEKALTAVELLDDGALETMYIEAKSLLATSQRREALEVLSELAKKPSTAQGAEACYILIQDCFDRGKFDEVRKKVYDFAPKAEGQNYWLAKAYITLGDAFVEQGNYPQARTTYESIRDGYQSDDASDDIQASVAEKLERLDSLN